MMVHLYWYLSIAAGVFLFAGIGFLRGLSDDDQRATVGMVLSVCFLGIVSIFFMALFWPLTVAIGSMMKRKK